jgi:histidinol phosphatase-like enzyme
MGLRLRLRADFPVGALPRQARIIAIAMQRYGIIVADNGTEWYVQGASNWHFNDDALHQLDRIQRHDFVVVDTSNLRNG